MSKRKGKKTDGGVSMHALQRIIGQYGSNKKECSEAKAEARKLLRACKEAAGSTSGRVLIASHVLEKYGFDRNKLKKMGIPDGKLFAILLGGTITNVMQVRN